MKVNIINSNGVNMPSIFYKYNFLPIDLDIDLDTVTGTRIGASVSTTATSDNIYYGNTTGDAPIAKL